MEDLKDLTLTHKEEHKNFISLGTYEGQGLVDVWNYSVGGFKDLNVTAQRVQTCVNSCEGISTESLENGIIPKMIAALRTLYFMACTSGGVAGPDQGLIAACELCGPVFQALGIIDSPEKDKPLSGKGPKTWDDNPKSVQAWLEQARDHGYEWAQSALDQNTYRYNNDILTLSGCVIKFVDNWCETVEGFKYWDTIYDSLSIENR